MAGKKRSGARTSAAGLPKCHQDLPLDENGLTAKDRWNYAQRCRRAERLGWPKPPLPPRRDGGAPRVEIKPETQPEADHWETRSAEAVRQLTSELAALKKKVLDHAVIRHEILRLAEERPPIPLWLSEPPKKGKSKSPGVPTLFLSDWHWGETVRPEAVGNTNAFDLDIAKDRAKALVDNAITVLKEHMVNPNYRGLILPLGGDFLSGDIHQELRETNALPTLPALVDLWGVMRGIILRLADEFGRVYIPCVTGNHGRTTQKPVHKERAATNYDWLLYTFLEKSFEGDKRVQFDIADGPDISWKVYGYRYCMTHGDQFRGGDGQVGALGPILRGDLRKRTRNSVIEDGGYDTLILGHWHQLIQMQRVIVNGSLKGMDEYAWACNFPFELPRQACWITHQERGITFQIPIQVETSTQVVDEAWVSWKRGA